ncbi:MAG: MBL fold metallo-hydrolase [Promethearchaeota archaeon]|jgi:L-ascorbate metabolism protein UlaG (beta-lactamase superfamily)
MKLRWLLTAAFEILTDNFKILIDPWISRPSNAPLQLKTKLRDIRNFDAIFLSHGHFDHSLDVPEIVKNTETRVYCSKQIRKVFIKEFNAEEENLIEINPGQNIEFKPDLKVTIIKSKHIQFDDFALSRGTLLRNANLDETKKQQFAEMGKYVMGDVFGFLMEFSNGKKVVHFGSGGYYEEELKKLPQDLDLFLAPVAGRGDADKVIAGMANFFKPKMIIPHHYDDFFPPLTWNAYGNFEEEVRKSNPNIIVNKLEHETFFEI